MKAPTLSGEILIAGATPQKIPSDLSAFDIGCYSSKMGYYKDVLAHVFADSDTIETTEK